MDRLTKAVLFLLEQDIDAVDDVLIRLLHPRRPRDQRPTDDDGQVLRASCGEWFFPAYTLTLTSPFSSRIPSAIS